MNQLDYLQQARQNVSVSTAKLDHYLGGSIHNNDFRNINIQGTFITLTSAIGLMGTLIAATPAIAPALGATAIAGILAGGAMVATGALYKAIRGDKIVSEKIYAQQLNNPNYVMLKDGSMSTMTNRDIMKKMSDGTLYNEIDSIKIKNSKVDGFYRPQNMQELKSLENHSKPKEAAQLMAKAIVLEEKGLVKTLANKITSIRDKMFVRIKSNEDKLKI